MENKLSCGIVRDLLPSYVEGLTCEETNEAVDAHLLDCDACKDILNMMKEPEEESVEENEIDYLKKIRRHGRRKIILTAVLCVGIVLMVLGIRFFYIGNETNASELAYKVQAEDGKISVKGMLTSSGLGVSRVAVQKNGETTEIKVYTTLKTLFNSGDFYTEWIPVEESGQVRFGGLIIWEDGKIISRTAARLYEARNPYVGNMSANGEIAKILFRDRETELQFDVWEGLELLGKYGNFRNELYTTKPPYGWHLELQEEQKADPEELYEEMRADACMMMATIENLGYVGWKFEAGGEQYKYRFFAEDATEFTGKDIKSWAESAAKLQELCDLLNIE